MMMAARGLRILPFVYSLYASAPCIHVDRCHTLQVTLFRLTHAMMQIPIFARDESRCIPASTRPAFSAQLST